MRTWTACKQVDAAPDAVLAALTVRRGGGLLARVAESATAALLQAGALGLAMDRIAQSTSA